MGKGQRVAIKSHVHNMLLQQREAAKVFVDLILEGSVDYALYLCETLMRGIRPSLDKHLDELDIGLIWNVVRENLPARAPEQLHLGICTQTLRIQFAHLLITSRTSPSPIASSSSLAKARVLRRTMSSASRQYFLSIRSA